MVLTALLLAALAVCLCVATVWKTFRILRLDPMQTLVSLGLAETPAPPTSRRRRS